MGIFKYKYQYGNEVLEGFEFSQQKRTREIGRIFTLLSMILMGLLAWFEYRDIGPNAIFWIRGGLAIYLLIFTISAFTFLSGRWLVILYALGLYLGILHYFVLYLLSEAGHPIISEGMKGNIGIAFLMAVLIGSGLSFGGRRFLLFGYAIFVLVYNYFLFADDFIDPRMAFTINTVLIFTSVGIYAFEKIIFDGYANHQLLLKRENTLVKKNKELETVTGYLNRFIRALSHEFKTPVNSGLTSIGALKRKSEIDEEFGFYLEKADDSLIRIHSLVESLFVFSKIDEQGVAAESMSLKEIVKEVAAKEKGGLGSNYTIEVDFLPDNIEFNFVGYRHLIRLSLEALLSNSIKYSDPERHNNITISLHEKEHEIHLMVRDTGIGFDEKYKEKIFGLFQRLHAQSEIPGDGVGLAVVNRVAQLHDGKIDGKGQPGIGSEFSIILPRQK